MKMKKTDIGVVLFMYAVCAFFYANSSKLSSGSKQYPLFTIYLLFGLTTLYLVQMLLNARRFGVESGIETIFGDFKPVQFFVSLALSAAYFFMIKYLGFFSATIIFMSVMLLFLRVPVLFSAITVVSLTLLIYIAFVKFLGVRLPKGILF